MPLSGEVIEDAIIAVMKADSSFDAVKAFVIGFQYKVPLFMYDYCEVAVVSETSPSEETGGIIRAFAGTIRFDVLAIDHTQALVDRQATALSYSIVKAYINRAVQLFRQNANRTLSDLAGDDWSVQSFEILDDVEYGIDSRADRENSYENFGAIPWVCEVLEDRQ